MELLPIDNTTGQGEKQVRMVQVIRDEHKALYKRYIGGVYVGYELFKIRKQEQTTLHRDGVEYTLNAKELFPSDQLFGKIAWALDKTTTEVDAIERYNNFNPLEEKPRGRPKKHLTDE